MVGSIFGNFSVISIIRIRFIFRYNIITVVFLGLFNIPNIGTKWLSYVLPVSCFIGKKNIISCRISIENNFLAVIPLFLSIKEEYNRRNVDEDEDDDENHNQT